MNSAFSDLNCLFPNGGVGALVACGSDSDLGFGLLPALHRCCAVGTFHGFWVSSLAVITAAGNQIVQIWPGAPFGG